MRILSTATMVVLIAFAVAGEASGAEPDRAEYAVRWEAADGGPKTAQEVMATLKKASTSAETYVVQYFDFTPPEVPAGSKPILRRRTKESGKPKLTFKYRSDQPLAAWTCPLPYPVEKQEEVDVSFGAAKAVKRAFSYSCDKKDAADPPAELRATPEACASTMTRLESDNLKVEEWRMPGNALMIEVSQKGPNSKKALKAFRQHVVAPLLKAGIKPSDRSKTEIGSRCP